jgi:TIR domain
MLDGSVPVFISYHGPDYDIAQEIANSLEALTKKSKKRFDVFVDKISIAPGDDFRSVIRDALASAHWFLIVCTGFPRPDADMAWSFFEAGQFSATLPPELTKEANRRMVCLYDNEIPSILAPLQGVKVSTRQKSSAKIDLTMPSIRTNSQYDETYIYTLFSDMLNNAPLSAIRDVGEESVKEDIREQCHKIINLFESSGKSYPIDDRPLQPRIWYELALGGSINNDTKVYGDNDSLNTLFSISTEETTWGAILNLIMKPGEPKPLWARDVEIAALSLAKDIIPETSTTKGILKSHVYSVFTARYQVFKDKRKCVYVVFLESAARPFDLKRASGTLLSALILGVRFRERLIPMYQKFVPDNNFEEVLLSFYRELQAVEIEALQYGLNADVSNPDDYPILTVIRDASRRETVEKGLKQWSKDRAEITKMFVSCEELPKNASVFGARLSKILEETAPLNSDFIQVMTEELKDQISA